MLRVLLLLFAVAITFVCIIYYGNPDAIKNLYYLKISNPKTWGKVEIKEDRQINNLKDFLHSESAWLFLEQVVLFLVGVLISVFIGWRFSSYHTLFEKPFEKSLTECLQRQNIIEARLGALELQIVEFERTYLYKTITTPAERSDTNFTTETTAKGELAEMFNKDDQNNKNEDMVRRAVEVIMQHDFEESNFECILEKLKQIVERLSKLSKENIHSTLDSDLALEEEQGLEVQDAKDEECNMIEILDTINEVEEVEETVKVNEEQQNTTFSKDIEENISENTFSEASCKGSNKLHPCESEEKLSHTMIVGAGESEDTFRGRIVPVSQIPQFQDLRRKLKPKLQKEFDDEKLIPFVSGRNTPEQTSPQNTPRRNNSASPESGLESTIRIRRRKPRS